MTLDFQYHATFNPDSTQTGLWSVWLGCTSWPTQSASTSAATSREKVLNMHYPCIFLICFKKNWNFPRMITTLAFTLEKISKKKKSWHVHFLSKFDQKRSWIWTFLVFFNLFEKIVWNFSRTISMVVFMLENVFTFLWTLSLFGQNLTKQDF